jgi:UDP-N-acetylglucosamine 2-epimerase
VAELIDLIAGARPNFMKIAPIIRAMESRKAQGGALRYRLVRTGIRGPPSRCSRAAAGT